MSNHCNIKTANQLFEKCGKFKYFGMTLTKTTLKKTKNRLNLENAGYHSVQYPQWNYVHYTCYENPPPIQMFRNSVTRTNLELCA